MKKHIPNFITCLNLLAGLIGILAVSDHQIRIGAWLIGIAAIFDFTDGFVARFLKAHSPLGKQLDSLADLVSFGVLPGMIMFELLRISSIFVQAPSVFLNWVPYLAMLIPVFSALRLAKFNIDERQSHSFLGLPTPANALLIASVPVLMDNTWGYLDMNWMDPIFSNMWFLAVLTLLLSFLLVSEIPLIALKFKQISFRESFWPFSLILFAAVLTFLMGIHAVPFIFCLYFLLSALQNFIFR